MATAKETKHADCCFPKIPSQPSWPLCQTALRVYVLPLLLCLPPLLCYPPMLCLPLLACFQELAVSSVYVLAAKMQKSAVTPIFASLFLSNCFYLCFLCVSLFSSPTEIIVLFAVFNTDANRVTNTETNTITYRQELVKMSKRFTCSCEAWKVWGS